MKLFPSVSNSITSSIARAPAFMSKAFAASVVAAMLALGAVSSVHAVEAASTTSSAPKAAQSQTVHINQATAEELADVLVGVGAAKAQAIVDYRKANGPFKSIEQLTEVKGIGDATITKNKARLSL